MTFSKNLLLNNGVTQWRCFRWILSFFFSNVRVQKVELAYASTNTNFFQYQEAQFLRNSALFCDVHFGAALHGVTLHGWWEHTLVANWRKH